MLSFCKVNDEASMINRITCNMCGNVAWDADQPKANKTDFLSVEKFWAPYSNKKKRDDQWDLCETCYDKLTSQFKIPITNDVSYFGGTR